MIKATECPAARYPARVRCPGPTTCQVSCKMTEPLPFEEERRFMIEVQLRHRGIRDERVLDAMFQVPRHEFVPSPLVKAAYDDRPLPLGEAETISQPYIVAAMTEAADVQPGDKALEVEQGAGIRQPSLPIWAQEFTPLNAMPCSPNRQASGLHASGTTEWKSSRVTVARAIHPQRLMRSSSSPPPHRLSPPPCSTNWQKEAAW